MTNILENGDFYIPDITGYTPAKFQYYKDFVQGQKDVFVWIGSSSDTDLSLQNNDNGVTIFNYPDITQLNIQGASSVNLYQYVSFENTAYLYQTINLTEIGIYNLSFLYVARPNYSFNNLQIFLNNLLSDEISTPQTSWTEYTLSFPVSTIGSYK